MSLHPDIISDEAIDQADADHFEEMVRASRMLNTQLGGMWPCGHWRKPETTHCIGKTMQCKRCRRLRLRNALRLIVDRRALEASLDAKLAGKRKGGAVTAANIQVAWENQLLDNLPIGKRVIAVVADTFGLSTKELLSRSRKKHLTRPRHMACKLLYELTFADGSRRFSYPQIGALMGGRDHSTIINGAERCEIFCQRDLAYYNTYLTLRRSLVAGGFIKEASDAD